MSFKHKILTLSLFAALVGALVLPSNAQTAGGRIVVGQTSDVLTLDPSLDTSPIGLNVLQNIFDQLSVIEADGSVGSGLATKWGSTPDLKTWTFNIRPNVKFHDGSPLSAEDVVWTYKKIMADDKSPVKAYLGKIVSIEASGEDKVVIVLNSAWAPFPRQVSMISILPKKTYESLGAEKFAKAPIGTGPYSVVKWVKDDAVELAAFEGYWGGAPKVKTVIFRPVPAEAARSAALMSGELDIVASLPPTLIERLSSAPGLNVEKIASNRVAYLGLNLDNPALADLRIRQAIDLAIDRTAISTRLLRGLGIPQGQIPAPVTFGYDSDIKPVAYDLQRAKALLQEAGYKGEKIVFEYPNNRLALGEQVAQTIAGSLTAIGMNIELRGMEYAGWFPLWTQRKMQGLYMASFGPSIMDSDLIAQFFFETGPSRGYWDDKRANELSLAQRAEPDASKRKAMLSEIWKLNLASAAYLPLYNDVTAYGIRKSVKWTPRADERIPLKDAEILPAR